MTLPPIAPFPDPESLIQGQQAILTRVALRLPFRPFLNVLGRLPIIGGAIGREVERILGDIEREAVPWAEASLGPAVDAVQRVRGAWQFETRGITATLEAAIGATFRVRYQALPNFTTLAINWTEKRIGDMVTLAYGLHGQALDYATRVGQSVRELAYALHGQALDYATRVGQSVRDLAYALHGQAIDYATKVDLDARNFAQALHDQETGYAQDLHAQALAYAQALALKAEQYAAARTTEAEEYARTLEAEALAYARRVGLDSEEYARTLAVPLQKAIVTIETSPCFTYCGQLGDLGKGLFNLDLLNLIRLAAEAERNTPALGRRIAGELAGPMTQARDGVLGLIRSV